MTSRQVTLQTGLGPVRGAAYSYDGPLVDDRLGQTGPRGPRIGYPLGSNGLGKSSRPEPRRWGRHTAEPSTLRARLPPHCAALRTAGPPLPGREPTTASGQKTAGGGSLNFQISDAGCCNRPARDNKNAEAYNPKIAVDPGLTSVWTEEELREQRNRISTVCIASLCFISSPWFPFSCSHCPNVPACA